jgi:hypothetical protein
MRKGFSIFLVVMLLRTSATAQIPRTLQIGVTNGTATVSSQYSPGYFFGYIENTTNLNPPIVWTNTSLTFNMESGESDNFSTTNSQLFFRLWQEWPVFEFAIFYNLNMEINPESAMVVNGPVFCNAGIWAGSSTLAFNSSVDAVGQIVTNTTNPFTSGWIGSGSPTFTFSGQPVSCSGLLNFPIITNNRLTNAEAFLNLPPVGLGAPNPAAYAPSNQMYIFNECDLIISNSASGLPGAIGTNIVIWFQDQYRGAILTRLTNDLRIQKLPGSNFQPTNILYAGFSFITNVSFYDYREAKNVQAVQIDITKFNKWLTNSAGEGPKWNTQDLNDLAHGIGYIYIYNNVPLSGTNLPAVRVINGYQLPINNYAGLTIATPQPLYVLGNYNVQRRGFSPTLGANNTTNTYPAALMADAITILSTNWQDSISNQLPNSGNTTVNAAMLTGIVPSDPSISGDYSGGVENFFRLLEDWSKNPAGISNQQTLTFNGSMVAMFPSIYATNHWQPAGNYYQAPVRHWAFDTNFTDISGLPPLTPYVINFVSP